MQKVGPGRNDTLTSRGDRFEACLGVAPDRIDKQLTIFTQAHDRLEDRRPFRTLNILDEGNRDALAIDVSTSLPSRRVTAVLDQLVALQGRPRALRRDHGPECMAEPLATWCTAQGIALKHIQPGKPNQNASIERFNRTYRYEVLDAWLFASLQEAHAVTADWLTTDNTTRPHDRLGGMPPLDFIPRPTSAPFVSELTVYETGRDTVAVDRVSKRQLAGEILGLVIGQAD